MQPGTWNLQPLPRLPLRRTAWHRLVSYMFAFSIRQFAFDLFECLAFRLRQLSPGKKPPSRADGGINPKGARRTQALVQQWKTVSEREAARPQSEHRDGHSGAANAVGEDLGEHDPGHGRQRAGVAP